MWYIGLGYMIRSEFSLWSFWLGRKWEIYKRGIGLLFAIFEGTTASLLYLFQILRRLLYSFLLNNNTKVVVSLSLSHIILFHRLSISLEMTPILPRVSPIQEETLFYMHCLRTVVRNGYSAGIFDFPKILCIFGNHNSARCNQCTQRKDSYVPVSACFWYLTILLTSRRGGGVYDRWPDRSGLDPVWRP